MFRSVHNGIDSRLTIDWIATVLYITRTHTHIHKHAHSSVHWNIETLAIGLSGSVAIIEEVILASNALKTAHAVHSLELGANLSIDWTVPVAALSRATQDTCFTALAHSMADLLKCTLTTATKEKKFAFLWHCQTVWNRYASHHSDGTFACGSFVPFREGASLTALIVLQPLPQCIAIAISIC